MTCAPFTPPFSGDADTKRAPYLDSSPLLFWSEPHPLWLAHTTTPFVELARRSSPDPLSPSENLPWANHVTRREALGGTTPLELVWKSSLLKSLTHSLENIKQKSQATQKPKICIFRLVSDSTA